MVSRMRIISCDSTSLNAQDAYRLRYSIYSSELNLNDESIDTNQGTLRDKFDDISTIYVAYDNNEAVASIRFFKLSDLNNEICLSEEIADLLAISRFPDHYLDKVFVASKFVIKPNNRGSLLAIRLMQRAYLDRLEDGGKFLLAYCDPYLIDMYTQLGFHVFGAPMVDKDAYLTPLIFVAKDWEHLKKVKSPFLRVAERNNYLHQSDESIAWFYATFSSDIEERNVTFDINEAVNALTLSLDIHEQFEKSPIVLNGFDHQEVKIFLSFCKIIKCSGGELFIKADQRTREMFIILSGQFSISFPGSRKKSILISRGQGFGEISLLLRTPRAADCTAMCDSIIAILSSQALDQFTKAQPSLAFKYMSNLAKILAYRLHASNYSND